MKLENIPIAQKIFEGVKIRENLIQRLGEKSEVRILNTDNFRGEITMCLTENEWAVLTQKVKDIMQIELEQAKVQLMKLDKKNPKNPKINKQWKWYK